MNAYKVEVKVYVSADEPARDSLRHVTAVTRQAAIYAAFDELTDMNVEVTGFGAVHVLVDDKWHETNTHNETSRV